MNIADKSQKTLSKVIPRFYVNLPKGGHVDVNLSSGESPVTRAFLSDLVIMYAFDVGTHYEIVSNDDLSRLGVSNETLHEQAVNNLRALNLEIKAHKGDRIMMLTADGNAEATLLLLPEVWASVSQMVEGEVVASIPARDILYVTGNSTPDNIADLRQWTSRMLEQADKPLSRAFFQWNGSKWIEYAGFAS